jgi:SLT domain-containing protein
LTKEELYRVMQGESNFNTTALNSDSGATGLFQFIPSTAEMLGYTTGEIQNMNASEQLAVYDQYLDAFDYRGGSLGIMQAAPGYASRGDGYEVYEPGSRAYEQNPGWVGADGKITVGSINSYYNNQALG